MHQRPHRPPPPPRGGGDGAAPPDGGEDTSEQSSAAGFEDALPLLIVGCVLASVLAGLVGVHQWLAPWMPFLAAAAAAVALSASLAFIYCGRDQIRTFKLGALIGVIVALPTALWMASPIRSLAAQHLADTLPDSTYETALDDGSEGVRVAACTAVGRTGDLTTRGRLVERLADEPALAARCLAELETLAPDTAEAMTHGYVRRWQQALEREDAAMVCQAAPHLFSAHTAEGVSPSRDLTICAVTSDSHELSRCCADALTERFEEAAPYVEALGDPGAIRRRHRQAFYLALIPHVFRGVDASRNDVPRLERRLLRSEEVERWLLGLACENLDDASLTRDYMVGLEAIIDSRSCAMPERGARDHTAWGEICASLAAADEPSDQLCEAVRLEATGASVRTARAEVHKALDALYSSEATAGIIAGDEQLRAFAASARAPGDLVAESIDERNLQAVGLGDARSREFARRLRRDYPEAVELLDGHLPEMEESDDDKKSKAQSLQGNSGWDVNGTESWADIMAGMTPGERQMVQDIFEEGIREAKSESGQP
jgi:hypothetical protein